MQPFYWILALDVWETGVLAMAMSTVSLVGSIAIYVWHRLRNKNAPHAEFIAIDGSHLKLSLSMSMEELTEQVRRIRGQLELFESSRAAGTTGDKPLSDDPSVRTR